MLRKKRPLIVWGLALLFLLSSAGIAGAQPAGQAQQTGATSFTDVSSTDKNALYISYMAKRGLITGFPDGTYHPGEGLTRAQAAVLFCKIRGLNATDKDSTFNDVAGSHWAAGYIAAAVKAGYITGFPDGTYRPEAILTRAQGIDLFLRLATEKDSSEEIPALQDLDKNHWAANSLAIALAAGMIEAEGNNIKPEQPFARGDLARALSILLTKDPGLNQQELIGQLKVKNGTVELKRAGSEKVQTINTTSIVRKGDTVITGKDGQAEINYPDGSGILLKPNSELIIKTSIGRAYIIKGGKPGTAVEDLQVELTNGKLFGALASKYTGQEKTEAKETAANNKYKKIASRDKNFGLMAAKTSEQPWYKTAEKKKVKVKVDMPWGVAAIRGSFWSNYTSNSGSGMSLLQGDGSLSSGGQTQNLSPGQSSRSGSSGGPPSPPGPMSPSEAREWIQQRGWVGERAGEMNNNQGAGDPGSEGQGEGDNQGDNQGDDSLTNTLNNALDNAAKTAGSGSSGSSGGGSGASGPSVPSTPVIGSILGSFNLQNAGIANGTVLTQDFGVSLAAGFNANEYELLVKNGSNYNPINEAIPVTQKVRYLAKLFEQPENLAVAFYRQGYYYPIGIARLNGNILESLANKTISGTISLESGVAPAGGMIVRVMAGGEYSLGYGHFEQEVVIPAGASSALYTLAVPDNVNAQGYRVSYYLYGTYSEPYLRQGEYPDRVGVIAGNQANINLTIGLGQVVSGKVVLPAPNNSDRKIYVSISADGTHYFSTSVGLANGVKEGTYSLIVAPGDYRLSYYINDQQFYRDNRYMRRAYYQSSTMTVGAIGEASTVTVSDQALSGMDLNVLPGGYYISGTISLPNPAGRDIKVYVGAKDASHSGSIYYTLVTIPAGQSSANYAIGVDEYYSNYKIGYSIRDGFFCKDNNYICAGYYNSGGMVNTPGEAEVCSVDSSGRENINLSVIGEGALISGNLSIPQVAPSGGLGVTIHASDDSSSAQYSTGVFIPAGETSVPYYLVVPGTQASYTFSAELPGYNTYRPNLATLQFDGSVATQDLTVQPVSGGGGSGYSPNDIANHSVLVCGKAFNLISSQYTSTNIAQVAGTCGLYYKSGVAATAGLWFDLLNPGATGEAYFSNSGNAVSPVVLGTIWDYSGGIYFNLGGIDIVVPVGWTRTRTCEVMPTDATLEIVSVPNTDIAEFNILSTTGQYRDISVKGNNSGTTSVSLKASKDGLIYEKEVPIRVIPLLTINPAILAQGYDNTSMTVSESVYSGSVWDTLDSLQLQLFMGNSAIPVTNVAIPSSVAAEDSSFTFTLPPGLEQGNYALVVGKYIDGVATPIGIAIFTVNALGNSAVITGATYEIGGRSLSIGTSGVISDSTFDPSKLIVKGSSGQYCIKADDVSSSSFTNDINNPSVVTWKIWLSEEAHNEIDKLTGSLYLDAAAGWNVANSTDAAESLNNGISRVP